MKRYIILHLALILSYRLYSQDVHFSQYQQTPALVNPALTGSSHVLRAAVIYRDQWRSVTVPYKTYGASFEMKLKASNWEKQDKYRTKLYKQSFSRLAAGLSFFRDRAGDGNMGTTQVNGSMATFIRTGKFSSIAAGLQASFVQQTIDFSKLTFLNQYSGTGYDPSLSSNENYASQKFIYADFAGGINWSYGFNERAIGANNEKRANIGVAIYHFNQPKLKYLIDKHDRLNAKYVFHADALIGIRNSNVALLPSYIFEMQGPSYEMIEGFMVKYYFRENSKYTGIIKKSGIAIGGAFRNKDAGIVQALFEYENYALGLSYDLNVSKLTKASSGRGGFEVCIRYVTPNPFLYQKSRARFN